MTEERPAPDNARFAAPTLDCDIVMKGGITSGVVYPLAISELAERYRFRNIGGTSAGAIAAAAAAAAEYSRRHGTGGSGFAGLEELPAFLSDHSAAVNGSNLFALFQPQAETAPIYSLVTAGMEKKGRAGRVVRAALTFFGGGALAGAAPGVLLALLAIAFARGAGLWIALAAALLVAVAGAVIGVAVSAARSAGKGLLENRFGMCDGMPGVGYGDAPALTPWLTGLLDGIAGITDEKRGESIPRDGEPPEPLRKPLTFGDLWGTDDRDADHDIELQFVTTNVTHGRPHRLPYETTRLYFDPEEMERYFPDWVVEWMVKRPRKPKRPHREGDLRSFVYDPRLRPLPSPADLPVVVAARLSLSFPFLFSAVPLYAVDFSTGDEETRTQERCWFSDGGLCSNFPVHFFDSPLPEWPTFAINLRDLPAGVAADPDPAKNVRMADSNAGGLTEWWTRFDRGTPLKQLGGFAAALIFAAKDWHDNVQLTVPGYRDRVVHVAMAGNEGGLNLNMSDKLIKALVKRGSAAGKKLGDRFSPAGDGTVMTWDNHRWIRFLNTMALLEGALREVRESFGQQPPPWRGWDELARRPRGVEPRSYPWNSNADRDECLAWVERLIADPFLAQTASSFEENAPNPRPELRIVPRI